MKKQSLLYLAVSTLAAGFLSGCGGGDEVLPITAATTPTAAGSISGSVVKGPVNAATVCVFKLDNTAAGKKGAAVAVTGPTAVNSCVVSAADGSYNLTLPAGTTGDLIVEASGGTYCSNEALYDATARACAGTGGTPIALSVAKLSTVIATPASGAVASAVITPLSTSAFANMVTAGLASVVAFRSQFTALVTTTGLPASLSADTLANDPTLQGVLASFQGLAGTDPAMLNTLLTGLANGSYRYGTGGFALAPVVTVPTPTPTPTPTPVTPSVPANASNGILGESLATVFAGDYSFSCRPISDTFSQTTPVTFAFKIGTDATSTLDGQPWITSTKPGSIRLSYTANTALSTATGSPLIPSNLEFRPSTAPSVFDTIYLFFKPDGGLFAANVTTKGVGYNCSAQTLTQVVPSTLVNVANSDFNSTFAKKIARTDNLACTVGGPQTLTLGADGSAAVAGLSFTKNQVSTVIDNTFATVPGSLVGWSLGLSKPVVSDLTGLLVAFNSAYKVTTVSAVKANGTAAATCP